MTAPNKYGEITMLTKDEFKHCFYGNITTDCAVRTKDYFIFSARDEEQSSENDLTSEGDVTKYGCRILLDEPEGKRVGKVTLKGWDRVYCAANTLPLSQFVCVSAEGSVYAVGSGIKGKEKKISDGWINGDGPNRFAVYRAKMLFGYTYVCGPRGGMARRIAPDRWEYLGHTFPDTNDIETLDNQRFLDIDGFSENDMYAVGGKGMVWHYDGKSWTQITFPTNMYLSSVCCGADGEVYIGAQSGSVFKGRNYRWNQIVWGGLATPFKDMVWFQDRIWATSDYGIWTIKGDRIEQPLIPAEVGACSGSMAVGDGVLLVAGEGGAAFHNGTLWQSLFLQYEMTEMVEKNAPLP